MYKVYLVIGRVGSGRVVYNTKDLCLYYIITEEPYLYFYLYS